MRRERPQFRTALINGFQVLGTHTYAHPGTFTPVVVIVDKVLQISANATTSVKVGPIPIVAHGASYWLTTRTANFSNVVATFTDAGPTLPFTSYSATISWGDGSVSTGKITGSRGSFVVRASHKFTRFTGVRTATVTITDFSGRRALATDSFSFS